MSLLSSATVLRLVDSMAILLSQAYQLAHARLASAASGKGPSALLERQAGTRIPDFSHMVAAGAYGPHAERDPTPARPLRSMVQRASRAQRLAWTDTPRGMGGAFSCEADSYPGAGPASAADRCLPKALSRRPAIAGHRDLGQAGGLICATVRLSDSPRSCHAPGSAYQLTEARVNSAPLSRRLP